MNKVQWTRCLRILLRNAQRGEESSFEFTVMLLPMTMMITLIAVVTLVRASQLPVWTAATACARAGIATLDESIGTRQAEAAGMNSLIANNISATSAPVVTVSTPDGWMRGKPLVCTVSYNINAGIIPGFSDDYPSGIPVSAEVELNIEGFKSKWDPALP